MDGWIGLIVLMTELESFTNTMHVTTGFSLDQVLGLFSPCHRVPDVVMSRLLS